MDLHRLRLFQALAGAGSFSKAAEVCHISQPALWLHIKHLEEELEIALVDRLPRGIRLTDAGRIVLEYSQRLFSMTEDMRSAVGDLRGLKAGRLVVGASTTPGTYILPAALGRFKHQHTGIELDLRIANTEQVENWVLNRDVVLGVIGQIPQHRDLHSEFYLKDRLVVIVSSRHRWKDRKSISLRDLATEPFLGREPGSNTRKTYEEALRKHGITVRTVMELGSTEAIKRAVAADLGISIVSPYSIQQEKERGELVALRLRQPEFERRFNIIYHRHRSLPGAAEEFLKMLSNPGR